MTTSTGPAGPSIDLDKLRKALTFFRVMAFVVGIGLLVLVVEMILSYGFGMKGHDNPLYWWPQPHGFLYIVYLAATVNLGFTARWPLPKMVGVMLAGCVPFLSFWVEHRVTTDLRRSVFAARDEVPARR